MDGKYTPGFACVKGVLGDPPFRADFGVIRFYIAGENAREGGMEMTNVQIPNPNGGIRFAGISAKSAKERPLLIGNGHTQLNGAQRC